MAIASIGAAQTIAQTASKTGGTAAASGTQPFGDTLSRMMTQVQDTHAAANDAVGRMLDGTGDVHEAMIALQRSDVQFQFAVQVKNKLVQAYQDIMRMSV
jgi:flagellar hook-basal body complex protein FliE